jgi:hypothetical protein
VKLTKEGEREFYLLSNARRVNNVIVLFPIVVLIKFVIDFHPFGG